MNWPLLKDRQPGAALDSAVSVVQVTSRTPCSLRTQCFSSGKMYHTHTLDTWKARTQIAPYISSFLGCSAASQALPWTADVEPTATRQYRSLLEMIYGVELGILYAYFNGA